MSGTFDESLLLCGHKMEIDGFKIALSASIDIGMLCVVQYGLVVTTPHHDLSILLTSFIMGFKLSGYTAL